MDRVKVFPFWSTSEKSGAVCCDKREEIKDHASIGKKTDETSTTDQTYLANLEVQRGRRTSGGSWRKGLGTGGEKEGSGSLHRV